MPATITEIIVSAGRTVNHPHESYSNLKPHVTLKATIANNDDFEVEYKQLAARAERLIEDHKENLLSGIRAIYDLREAEREMTSLERQINQAQQRLENIREDLPTQTRLLDEVI
jgi:hypothetical protein